MISWTRTALAKLALSRSKVSIDGVAMNPRELGRALPGRRPCLPLTCPKLRSLPNICAPVRTRGATCARTLRQRACGATCRAIAGGRGRCQRPKFIKRECISWWLKASGTRWLRGWRRYRQPGGRHRRSWEVACFDRQIQGRFRPEAALSGP